MAAGRTHRCARGHPCKCRAYSGHECRHGEHRPARTNPRRETFYYAITSTGAAGWNVIAGGASKAEVRERAVRLLLRGRPMAARVRDIYLDTELKNLRVVTRTAAKRYGVWQG